MISYNPRAWFGLIFRFHSSDTFRILLPTMCLLGLITAGLTYVEHFDSINLKSPTIFHQIIGFVLSMLLVFRINTAYERWWEGRRLWGSLINNSRSLAAKLSALVGEKLPEEATSILNTIATFPFALKDHLRSERATDLLPALPGVDRNLLTAARHRPLYLYNDLVRRLEKLRTKGAITDEQMLYINPELFSLIDITGACERIKSSPIPYSYSLFLKKIIFLYVITLPLAFSLEYDYWAIVPVMLIFYAFASLELVSEEIEDPFGTEANDLPTDELAAKIREDILAIEQAGSVERSAA